MEKRLTALLTVGMKKIVHMLKMVSVIVKIQLRTVMISISFSLLGKHGNGPKGPPET
jgi:hypothetical protein